MAISQSSVLKLYHGVIEDVIAGVRETFLDDGVDEQVLQELRQLWETKLLASKAVERTPERAAAAPPPIVANHLKANGKASKAQQQQQHQEAVNKQEAQQPQQSVQSSAQTSAPQQSLPSQLANVDPNQKVPVQLTLPPQPPGTAQRVFTLQIPASALHNNQLHQVLTGPVITATMNLPQHLAASLLQQHINAALAGNLVGGGGASSGGVAKSQLDGGGYDSSDEELSDGAGGGGAAASASDADGPDDEADDAADDDEEADGEDGDLPEEEPLNSDDDVSEEDTSEMFDTDNVVVCQYDKITRSRNKWKFYLKDGIMNLSGKDFVFQKANGDAEW